MTDLKACPFCGGEAGYHVHQRIGIECGDCGAGFACIFPDKATAARAWNARAEATQDVFSLRKAVEGLEGQLADLVAENGALRAENEHLREVWGELS